MRYITSTLILISLCFAIVACSNSPTLSKEEVSDLVKDFATTDIIENGSVSYCETLLEKIKTSDPLLILYDDEVKTWSVNMPSHFENDYWSVGYSLENPFIMSTPSGFKPANHKVQKEISYSWTVNDKTQVIKSSGKVTFRVFYITNSGAEIEMQKSDYFYDSILSKYSDRASVKKSFC